MDRKRVAETTEISENGIKMLNEAVVLLEETQEIAINTAAILSNQGKQIKGMVSRTQHIDGELSTSNKLINGLSAGRRKVWIIMIFIIFFLIGVIILIVAFIIEGIIKQMRSG